MWTKFDKFFHIKGTVIKLNLQNSFHECNTYFNYLFNFDAVPKVW